MFKGRALLTIDRLEGSSPKDFRWDIDANILRLNHDDPGGEVPEAFSFIMAHDCYPAPDAAYKMSVGDRIRVLAHFEIHYTKGDGYSTDDDSEMYLERQRVLRRQPYTENRFRKKFYKFWREGQKSPNR